MLAIDWDATSMAGAFAVGYIAGVFATVRLTRVVGQYLAGLSRDADPPATPDQAE